MAIASLVVQLMILAIVAFWSVEILAAARDISHWSECLTVPTPAGCESTPIPTSPSTPTPTSGWSGF